MTEWKWRIMLFVRAADDTAANRTAFAKAFADNGSGESEADERKMLDNATRFSSSGNDPAQAFGVNTAAKGSMRTAIKALLDGLTNARYVVVANTDHGQWKDGELVLTNFPVTPKGQIVDWADALVYIENQFGLVPIVEDPTQ